MKPSSFNFLLILCILGYSCNHPQKPRKKKEHTLPDTLANGQITRLYESNTVSIVRLIANPEQYDGKKIQVIGYCHLEFEGDALYLNKDDFDYDIKKNAIWLTIDVKHPEESNLIMLNNHYVLIEGTFDSHNHGHMDACYGSIKDITHLELRPKTQ